MRFVIAALLVFALTAVVFGTCIYGPASLRWAYRRDVNRTLDRATFDTNAIAAADLAALPEPVRRYLHAAGVDAGSPRVRAVYARMHGRIRSGPDVAWLPFTAEQVNDFRDKSRYFYMDATKGGLPIQGFHRYADGGATMRVNLAGLFPVVSADGTQMTIAETVTLFNDMAVLAPATLIDPAIQWEAVDDCTARAVFTNAGHAIHATLSFDSDGRLIDFSSDDRRQASPNGTMRLVRWSTPLTAYRAFGAHTLASRGEGRWHEAAGPYAYIEIAFDDVRYDGDIPRK